jgi:hypothetical protein
MLLFVLLGLYHNCRNYILCIQLRTQEVLSTELQSDIPSYTQRSNCRELLTLIFPAWNRDHTSTLD